MTPNFTKFISTLLLIVGITFLSTAQNNAIISSVLENEAVFQKLKETSLLQPIAQHAEKGEIADVVNNATLFKMEKANVNALIQSKAPYLSLTIPRNNADNFQLKLFKANVFSPEFKVTLASDRSSN